MTVTITKHEFEGHPYVTIEAESGGIIDLTEAEWAELGAYAAAQADTDPRHIIDLRDGGWTIKHPLSCRPKLFDCPVNRAAERDLAVRPAAVGRYECGIDDGDFVIRAEARS